MERLLTPLVTRLLERFVKTSQEGDAGKFKVSLSGAGGFSLHNLELDLGSVLPAELLESRRAFARSLQIKVPWTSLNTQPIEVIFDTVEIVLGDPTQQNLSSSYNEQTQDDQSDLITANTTNTSTTTANSGGGWLGLGLGLGLGGSTSSSWLTSNLQSLALRAGLNLSFTIKNLLVKYVYQHDFAVTVALEQLVIANRDAAEWQDLVESPELWLMKNCLVKGLSISIDTIGSRLQSYLPLLRLNSLSIAALLPIFAYLEGGDLVEDDAKVAVEVQLGNVQGAVNDQQIEWMYSLLEKLRKDTTSLREEKENEEHGDEEVLTTSIDGENIENAEIGGEEEEEELKQPEEHVPQMKALGFFSRIWDVAVDEASYIRNLEETQEERKSIASPLINQMAIIQDLNQPSLDTPRNPSSLSDYPNPPTQAELTLTLNALHFQLGVANNDSDAAAFSSITSTTTASPRPRVLGPCVVPLLDINIGLTRVCTASISTTMVDVEMQVQNVSVRHNSTASSGQAIVHLLTYNEESNSTTGGSTIVAEEEPVWDEFFGIHPCQVPLRSAGRLRSPENALEIQKNILDLEIGTEKKDDESILSVHVGQVWIALDPLLRQHIELFMARLERLAGKLKTAPLTESNSDSSNFNKIAAAGAEKELSEKETEKSISSGISGWDIEIDALQVALRCSMKDNTTDTSTATATATSITSAALLIQATEAISYHTTHTANAFRPQGFQCPLIFSVVHGSWQPMTDRSGQHSAAVPGAVTISKTFTLRGSLGHDASMQGPFFSISPLELDGSGEEIAAALTCILAAVAGAAPEPRDPLPLLSGWGGRAQLSLKQGLRINKDLKNNGIVDESAEKAWEVFAESLNLILTSKSNNFAPDASVVGSSSSFSTGAAEEEVCASLDMMNLRCCASPGLAISVDLACLGVETQRLSKGEENKLEAPSAPPPLAVLTNMKVCSEETTREYTFGSLNIMSDPSTTRAAIALAAGFSNSNSAAASNNNATAESVAVVSQRAEHRKLSSSEEEITTIYGFNMVIFTLFPAKTDLQTHTAATTTAVRGATGWLSSFSLQVGPMSRLLSLNSLELSQCRFDGLNSEIVDLPLRKVLCFERRIGTSALKAAATIISSPTRQPQEQFTVELAPLKARVTPEFLSILSSFLPQNSTQATSTVITESLIIDSDYSTSVTLLHGNVTIGSFTLELAQEEAWKLLQDSSSHLASSQQKPLLSVSFDEAFLLIHQELASERRPWLYGTPATALTASALVLGLGARVENHAGGKGSGCTQILLPADINALIHQWSPTGSLVVALEAHTLDFKVSKNVVDAVASLANAYSDNESAQPFDAVFGDNKVLFDVLSDDLRSGAFILAGADATMAGLQPLRAAVRSLGGRGKESLEWRYDYPRSIGCVFIQGMEPSDFPAPLSLSRLDETIGQFINVDLWPKIIQGSCFWGTCFFIAEGAQDTAAQFWRVCWTSPADISDAKSLLNRIYINPQSQELWNIASEDALGRQKSPLVAPLSFGVSFDHIDVSLLASHSSTEDTTTFIIPSVHILNVLALLKLENVLVSMHTWNTNNQEAAMALDVAMTASVEYVEATTLCSATLVEPFDVILSFEDVSDDLHNVESPQPDGVGRFIDSPLAVLRGSHTAAGGLAGVQEDAMVFAARRKPVSPGTYVKCDFITPFVVNISELAVYDLQRLVALATTAPGAATDDVSKKRPFASPIKISNWTNHCIGFQQYGISASATLLAPGASSGFHWAAIPRMKQGAQLALQLALIAAGNDGNIGSVPAWSNAIDVMTVGGASLVVPGSEYSSATVAVKVERDEIECTWHVQLQHGLRIYNRQDMTLKALVMNPSGPKIVEIKAWGSEDIALLSAGVGGAGSPVRLWLGNGWSKEFYSRGGNEEIRVLEADSNFQFEVVGHESNVVAAPLVAQFAGNDACTGHVVVAIWPPVKLSNELPQSITLKMPQKLTGNGESASLGPSETVAIPVDINGGEIAQLTSGLAREGNSAKPSVAIICPPLISTEADSPLIKGISGVASDNAIYILSPGNAAQFLLPWPGLPNSLPCFLLTDANDVSPGLSLKLIPQWKVINKLAIPVDLELSQSRTISIPSDTTIADDLRASSVRQMTLSIMYEQLKYSSREFLFDLENPIDQQLSLLPSQTDKSLTMAPARVGLELKLIAVGDYKAFELIISPSYYLENNSSSALTIREPFILGSAIEKEILLLRPQCSVPLLFIPEHLEVSLSEDIQDIKQTWHAFPLEETRRYGCILIDGPGERSTLSYGIISEATRQRLIFFRDPDAPVCLLNNYSRKMHLSWTSGDDQLATLLNPGQKLEFAVENEIPAPDAWDDSVFAADLRAHRTVSGCSILLKAQDDEEWQEVLLEEGEHQGGSFNVRKQRKGAGIVLIVEEKSAKQIIKTLNASIQVEQFCVLLRDDERGRITGINEARPTVAFVLNRLDLSISKALEPPSQAVVLHMRFEELRCSTCFPAQQLLLWSADSAFSTAIEMVITTIDGDQSISISDAAMNLPSLFLHIDDASFELYVQYKTLFGKPTGFQETIASVAALSAQDEAKTNLCAKRVHINNLQLGKLNASADIHLSPARTGLPMAVDTDQSPLSISKISISSISLPFPMLLQGLTKHIVTEALLNAPLVLGSLQLFFNPTGLVRSIQRGVANMIELPLQGLQQGPLQFIAGVGQGSVSLVREISGWSLSSVVGFSRAASNALVGSFARSAIGGPSQTPSSELEALPEMKASLVYGFASLAAHLRCSLSDPTIGEILLSAVASDTKICQKEQAVFQIIEPVMILATNAIILYSDNGRTPSLVAWLTEASVIINESSLEISSSRAAPISDVKSHCPATIIAKFHRTAWDRIAPSVRRLSKNDIYIN